ncbi:MAG TPA: hypothetical protein VKA63_06955 [Candidatus Krumholzibacteria bacterium]|nr:hypothetical protein [Candidatus Krumholzibacteria bacterium]
MGRISKAIAFTLLLCGCASANRNAQTDPSASGGQSESLPGVTSDYSIRLSEMPNYDALAPDSVMREGLVAGDNALHVAVAAFRVGTFYGLDLIVTNREDKELEISRDDLRMVDSKGQWLEAVSDFHGADLCGLRGKSARENSNYAHDNLGLDGPEYSGDTLGYAGGVSTGKGEVQAPVSSLAWKTQGSGVAPNDWSTVAPVAPYRLEVPAQEGRAWWAYWRADRAPAFPVTAFVTVEGRHLIFVFDEPGAAH